MSLIRVEGKQIMSLDITLFFDNNVTQNCVVKKGDKVTVKYIKDTQLAEITGIVTGVRETPVFRGVSAPMTPSPFALTVDASEPFKANVVDIILDNLREITIIIEEPVVTA